MQFKQWVLCLGLTASLSATDAPLPEYIDLHYLQTTRSPFAQINLEEMGYLAFNSAPEFAVLIAYLIDRFALDTAVETGTYCGGTTRLLALLFEEVHTIEISEGLHQEAETKFATYENVACHLGSSEQVLAQLLPTLKQKRPLFYLDAHWNEYWPLLDELEAIGKTHRDNCIIMIDDFKVPGRKEMPYDKYGDHECSYDYIKAQLDKVFSSYTFHYVLPRNRLSRAKCVVIPKQWKNC